jgi:translation initiation factor 4A
MSSTDKEKLGSGDRNPEKTMQKDVNNQKSSTGDQNEVKNNDSTQNTNIDTNTQDFKSHQSYRIRRNQNRFSNFNDDEKFNNNNERFSDNRTDHRDYSDNRDNRDNRYGNDSRKYSHNYGQRYDSRRRTQNYTSEFSDRPVRSSGYKGDYKSRRDKNDRRERSERFDKFDKFDKFHNKQGTSDDHYYDNDSRNESRNDSHNDYRNESHNDYRNESHNDYRNEKLNHNDTHVESKVVDDNSEPVTLDANVREYIELPESINDFEEMKFISENLFRGIHEYGFKYPSPIQSKTIHIINSGCDLIAQAQSGSGKTGAFAIGSLSRIDPQQNYPQVLIIANTRLLALQIHKVIQNISQHMGVEIVACVGGHKNNSQMNAQQIRFAHVLVGTPGRVSEMLTKKAFDGKKIKTLIMDESDVLLKDDFKPQIIEIISKLNEKTQICIFSATFTKETLQLTENFLSDPYRVTVEKEDISVKGILQYKINVGYEKYKFATLTDLFSQLSFTQMIIFVRSIRSAEDLRNRLMDQNIQAGLVHGKMNSIDRENVLKEFRLSYIKILISTDVMCRGIDIDDLRIVINYDMPDDEETYIHRIGRSGRYGGQGVAINFCTHDDNHKIRILVREFNLDILSMPDPDEVNTALIGMKPPVGKVSSAKNYM